VATNIMGRSGREMLAALVEGTTDPAILAQLARGRLREKIPQLERALAGHFGPHQRFMIGQQLAHLDFLEESIERLSGEIEERLRPFAEALVRLEQITGVGQRTAQVLLAEIGGDMSRFPTDRHLASWAGRCPGNRESGGKRQNGRTRKGSPWLRAALVEAAQAAGRSKDTYLAAQYHRLASRRGKKRAAVAVGHTILVTAYHLLKANTTYQDLGGAYFDERHRQALQRRLVHRLEGLGYSVTLEPQAAAA
jgi:transposase